MLFYKTNCSFKKIKELKVGLIDDEIDALNILKNNSICTLIYLINGGETAVENLIIPYYHLIITKNENQIEIHLEGVEDTSSCPSETRNPEKLLNNDAFFEEITKQIRKDISDRLEIIVGKPITFDYKNCYTFGYSYHLNYTYKL